MGGCQHSLFVRQSILSSLQIVLFESFIELDDLRCHQPYHASKMSIASLRDLPFPIHFPRLVESRIEPCHRNHFLMTLKLLNLSAHLDQKIGCTLFPNSFHRSKNIHIFLDLSLAQFDEDIRKLLEMFSQLDQ